MNQGLAPLGVLFREAWRTYKEAFPATIRLSIVLAVVTQLFAVVPQETLKAHPFVAAAYAIVALCIVIWFGTTLSIAMYFATADRAALEWHLYYDRSRPLWGRFLRTKALQGLMTVIGLILFIFPGIIAFIRFAVADWVAVFEGLPARESLRRSSAYVKGHGWQLFVALAALFLSIIPFELVLALFTVGDNPTSGAIFLYAVVNTVIVSLITPWAIAYMNVIYNNLRKIEAAPSSSTTSTIA